RRARDSARRPRQSWVRRPPPGPIRGRVRRSYRDSPSPAPACRRISPNVQDREQSGSRCNKPGRARKQPTLRSMRWTRPRASAAGAIEEEEAMESSNVPPRGSGWLSFAAVMIGLVGVFNIIWGLVALIQDDYFVADELLFADLSLWGVIYLIIGGIQ